MKIRLLTFMVIIMSIPMVETINAQDQNYGTWTSISIEKELKKWDLSAETELRTIYYARLINRWSLGLNAEYNLLKYLKVGIGYQFMNTLDSKYLNYQLRNRATLSATGKIKLNDFTLTLREKIQTTQKDESKRLLDNDSIDTYKINPEWSWRNRVEVKYNIPNCKITPSFSVESFYQLNNSEGNTFDNIRYMLSFDYKIDKQNHIEVYGLINRALESEDAYGKYILGVGYIYSF